MSKFITLLEVQKLRRFWPQRQRHHDYNEYPTECKPKFRKSELMHGVYPVGVVSILTHI